MKMYLKKFTFWFVLVGILGVILNLVGIDDIGLFIGFNPILNLLSSSSLCSVIADIPYMWHILSLVTMTMYGLVLDMLFGKKE